jgi:O-antigen ligase
MAAYKYLKILVYFLLLISLLDTPTQFRRFLGWLGIFILFLALVALLHWHEMIHFPAIAEAIILIQRELDNQGENVFISRLQGTGFFNDPNDLCLILVAGMAISLGGMTQPRTVLRRVFWLACFGAFGYALYLTKSRGGFIAMLAGLLVLFYTRLGWWRTLFLSVIVLPVIFLLFSGRATELSAETTTAQTRLQLWSQALDFFREAPFFGIGEGEYQEYSDEHFVAHNSFLHAFAELGFFGGTIFLGAFYYAFWVLSRLGSRQVHVLDPELRRLRPFVLTITGGYGAGLLSLSRITIVPTYMILGLGAAYLQMVTSYPPLTNTRFGARLMLRLVLVSLAFLLLSYLYVRTNVRWG